MKESVQKSNKDDLNNKNSEQNAKTIIPIKLTPKSDIELGDYKDYFDNIFLDNDIKNVAITGTYGSGKSSHIETYKKINNDKLFIHISLAEFDDVEKSKVEEKQKNFLNTLEGKIINQLLHQISPKQVPLTRFRVKNETTKISIIIRIIGIMIFLLSFLHVILYENWSKLLNSLLYEKGNNTANIIKNILLVTTNKWFILFSIVVCILLFSIAMYQVYKLQIEKNIIKKLSLKGNEIDFFNEETDSLFDKHLDEILYIFSKSKVDVIVFEDMDRFEVNKIFSRLREINLLINQKKPSNEKNYHITRFFYLLRDDVFESKDRSKFFDAIIPIIPVMTSSNSFNLLINKLVKYKLYSNKEDSKEQADRNKLSESFLQDLSLYLDDYRLLINIVNEYYIYFHKLKIINLNLDKLMALTAYKNIFPKDYERLQIGTSYINYILRKRSALETDKQKFYDDEIEKLKAKIKSLEISHKYSEHEAIALFFLYGKNSILVENISLEQDKTIISNADLVEMLISTEKTITVSQLNGNSMPLDIEKEIENIKNIEEYIELSKKTESSINIEKEECMNKIKELEESKRKTYKLKLDSLITYSDFKAEKERFLDIANCLYFDLAVYFLRNEYIDDSYEDYLSPFDETNIKITDKDFLISVTSQKALPETYHLVEVKKILSRLDMYQLEQKEAMNFYLLTMIINNMDTYREQWDYLVTGIMRRKEFRFIYDFVLNRTDIQNETKENESKKSEITRIDFLIEINKKWETFFKDLIKADVLIPEEINDLIAFVLSNIDIKENNLMNSFEYEDSLIDYMNNKIFFLEVEWDTDRLKTYNKNISFLNCQFKTLKGANANNKILDCIYENNLYELNYDNMLFFVERNFVDIELSEMESKFLTHIVLNKEEILAKQIFSHIASCMTMYLNNFTGEIQDDEDTVIDILNNNVIERTQKEKYLNKLNTKVKYLFKIHDRDLWEHVILNNNIILNDENFIDYFVFIGELDETIINFVNSDDQYAFSTAFEDIDGTYYKGKGSDFLREIVQCNALTDRIYEIILTKLKLYWNEFPNYMDIEETKFKILIDEETIKMTDENLIFVRKHYNEHLIYFVIHNISKYIEIKKESKDISLDELLMLLNSEIKDNNKIELVEISDYKSFSIQNDKYSNKFKEFLLNEYFDSNDFEYLMKSFSKLGTNLHTITISYVEENILKVIENIKLLDKVLYFKLIQSEKLTEDEKFNIFSLYLENLKDKKDVIRSLELIKKDVTTEFLLLLDGGNRLFIKNTENLAIIDIFKRHRWIGTIKDADGDKLRVYGRRKK